MDKRFEKLLIILMATAFTFLVIVDTTSAASRDIPLENQYPGIMRFHVIANSDSDEDQELKLKVRDYVLENLQKELAAQMIKDKEILEDEFSESKVMRQYISNNLDKIEFWGKEALALYNSQYGCQVSMGIRHIPAKYYDDVFFPEGNYEALTITIGDGEGQNWWCVVFPPLCLVDSEDSPYTDKLNISEEEKIVLKSKLIELMEETDNHEASISAIIKGICGHKSIDVFFVNFIYIFCESG